MTNAYSPGTLGITLGVVDQSPMRGGGTAAQALQESVGLAQAAERFGYSRYWVAEHHNAGGFAGAAPEILIGQIAAHTSSIHVGSGGVMLSHYSALKVAEQFSILNSFYPGRIDLGIGRAPGSDQLTAAILADPRPIGDIEQFPRQVMDLLGFFYGFAAGHPYREIRAHPGQRPETHPEVWLLGSSDYSAKLAAALGLPYAFAEFFGITGEQGPLSAAIYREEFRPSPYLAAPKMNVTLQVTCAPTAEEARFVASSRRLTKANRLLRLGLKPGLLPPEEASGYPLSQQQRQYMEGLSNSEVDGDPDMVREGISRAAKLFGTTDIGIVCNCYRFEDRVRSYEMTAKALGLSPA